MINMGFLVGTRVGFLNAPIPFPPPHAELNFLFQHVWDGLPGSREGRRVTKAGGFCWDNSEPNKARLFADISDIISQRPSYPQHPAPFLLTKTASFESIWIQKKWTWYPGTRRETNFLLDDENLYYKKNVKYRRPIKNGQGQGLPGSIYNDMDFFQSHPSSIR